MLAQDFLPRSQPWTKSSNLCGTGQAIGPLYIKSLSPVDIASTETRVAEAINARDVVVQRLASACISIRQKTALIEQLEKEKIELKETLGSHTTVCVNECKKEDSEVPKLEEMVRALQEEIKLLRIGRGDQPPEYDDDSSNVVDEDGIPAIPASDSLFKTTDDPEERLKSRHALLASLPLPTDIPSDALRPIVIPSTFGVHEFISAMSSSQPIKDQLANYRVFQQLTTAWCPDREEHGYHLTPVFKCNTSPRTMTAHNWSLVDVICTMNKPTECFYSRDGKWYYAGMYKAVRLEDLTATEWNNLSNETMQALIRETLVGRRGVSPQNMYETGQLYSVGALKVACVGLQCVGFNNRLYRTVLDHAAKFAQGTKWKGALGTGGAGWNIQTNTSSVTGVSEGKGSISLGVGRGRGEGKEND